jgi:hypothetical protein
VRADENDHKHTRNEVERTTKRRPPNGTGMPCKENKHIKPTMRDQPASKHDSTFPKSKSGER